MQPLVRTLMQPLLQKAEGRAQAAGRRLQNGAAGRVDLSSPVGMRRLPAAAGEVRLLAVNISMDVVWVDTTCSASTCFTR